MWSHSVVEHLLCEVMCLGVRDGAAETLLTGVKVVPETMYLGKSSIGGDIAHIGDYLCLFVFIILYVSSAFLPPPLGDLQLYRQLVPHAQAAKVYTVVTVIGIPTSSFGWMPARRRPRQAASCKQAPSNPCPMLMCAGW